jgi:hypothetical protein
MFFPAAALFLASLTTAHAYTIVSADNTLNDNTTYTGASLDKAAAFDPDMFVSPFGSLGQVVVGSVVGLVQLPTYYVLSGGGVTERLNNMFVERGVDSLDVALLGDLFNGNSLISSVDAVFELSQPGGPGNRVSLSFEDVAFSPVNPMSTPEVSTWMMVGLGLVGAGFVGWRKRAMESVNT